MEFPKKLKSFSRMPSIWETFRKFAVETAMMLTLGK